MIDERTSWQQRVEAEVLDVVRRVAEDTTRMWETGELDGLSSRGALTDDFVGVQDAPWFDEPFTADADTWMAGTAEAAGLYKGRGIRWETDRVTVLPRSEEEAAVAYRVTHHWGDDRPPARALFLEVWVKRDGRWMLRRHASEKA